MAASATFENREFVNVKFVETGRVVQDFHFDKVTFDRCFLGHREGTPSSLTVRDVVARDCSAHDCAAYSVFFDDVRLDSLTTRGSLDLYGCAFRHVVLTGHFGRIIAQPPNRGLSPDEAERAVADVLRLYADTDWALDISGATFEDSDFYYVPGDLVRRDPRTQFLLRRRTFESIDASELPAYPRVASRRFRSTPFDSYVVVPPTNPQQQAKFVEQMEWAKSKGFAE